MAMKLGNDKKKKKDGMSAILPESVLETVLEDFKANTSCTLMIDGESVHVGLLLRAEDIGGINKKSKKDEAKGSMVECINSRRIKTLITEDLMNAEELIFIPDVETLDAMDEFNLLREAPYSLVFVYDDYAIINTGNPVTFAEIVEAVEQDSVDDLLITKGLLASEAPVEPDGNDEVDVESDDVDDSSYGIDETPFEMSEVENVLADEDDELIDVNLDEFDYPVDEDETYELEEEEIESEENEVIEVDAQFEEDDSLVEVSDEEFTENIIRKFYSGDLDLVVPTDAFDSQFVYKNECIGFEVQDGTGWLDGYVANMHREANTQLRRLHQENLFKAREMYHSLLALHVEKIQRDLDIEDASTDYGRLLLAVKTKKVNEINALPDTLAIKKKQLVDTYNANLEQVATDAANAAKKSYRERYHLSHEDKLDKLPSLINASIENDYQSKVRELNESRKNEALKRLDYGITETLREVSDIYLANLKKEDELFENLRSKISSFIDENRKVDISRADALAADLAQNDKLKVAQERFRVELETQNTERKALLEKQQAELAMIDRNHKSALTAMEHSNNKKIAELESKIQNEMDKYEKLLGRFANLDKDKDAEYRHRLEEMRDINQNLIQAYKSKDILRNTIFIVALLAVLAFGVLLGVRWGIGEKINESSNRISEDVNSRLDNIEDRVFTEVTPLPVVTVEPTSTPIVDDSSEDTELESSEDLELDEAQSGDTE